MLTSAEIRRQFIAFFEEKAHTFVPSSPVVPYDDPTLMFTNAGMNQFKDVFLGTGQRDYRRAANSQKCIRAGGKHNDLDDVGHDTYHHTFFEMLGNWSFGDYFKQDAIVWAWELLTERWGIDKTRLHATVFGGEPGEGLDPDDEAAELWRSLTDIHPDHVHYCGKKDNFWEMGDTGPCGPCSEIHIDITPDKSGAALINADDPRVMEIWNLVFIQYNRASTGKLTSLPAQHVDTGMGLERVSALLQGVSSNYDTDLFTTLFAAIREITAAPAYTGRLETAGHSDPQVMVDVAYRVIADHLRCLTFAITDGAHLSNEGRGYVLRRILRRAVRYGRQYLDVHEPFLHRLVGPIIDTMGAAFPELALKPAHLKEVLLEEEESFGRTFERGVRLFDEAAREVGDQGRISGETAFKLHDTYGFPYDLTVIMATERGMQVDETGYERLMEEARERARGAGGDRDMRAILTELSQHHELSASQFVGYGEGRVENLERLELFVIGEHIAERAKQAAVGDRVIAVLSQTPFYAEAGGQVGDRGTMRCGAGVMRVDDTQKIGDVYYHIGEITSGPFSATGSVAAMIDSDRRSMIMANHTATHLMNWALRQTLGDHVDQKGSLVDEDKTRFDFSHGKAVSSDELHDIESATHRQIESNLEVHTAEVPEKEARAINTLRAVFGEKYPAIVRVVSIGRSVDALLADPGNPDWMELSVEFCGGTHMPSTADIAAFRIIEETSVAKGIRRITAVTGDRARRCEEAATRLRESLSLLEQAEGDDLAAGLQTLARELGEVELPAVVRGEIRDALKVLQKRHKAQDKQAARADQAQVKDAAKALLDGAASHGEARLIVGEVPQARPEQIREAIDLLRTEAGSAAIVLGSVAGEKVLLFASVTDDLVGRGIKAGDIIRQIAPLVGGGGGGKPQLAQAGGRDPAGLPNALDEARRLLQEQLA